MPKIRDLGINVIPEMTRPPEIGMGGGCGHTSQCVIATHGRCTGPSVDWTPLRQYACGTETWVNCPTPSNRCEQSFGCQGHTHCGGYSHCGGYTNCGTTDNCPTPSKVLSDTCADYGSGLRREDIIQLKKQLQRVIEQLDEVAKSIGPKTAAEIDAREKELQEELAELARRRQELDK